MSGNALDIGPNGFHGTVSGAVLGPDQDGNPNGAYYFDGINDFIDLPFDPLLKPDFPFTIACVVMYDAPLTASATQIFTTDFEQNNYHGAWSNLSGGRAAISYGGGAGNVNSGSRRTKLGTTVLNADQWYRLTFIVRGPTDMEIYIDCVNDGGTYSGSGPTGILYTGVPGSIGRTDSDMSGPAHYFEGAMSDFRMWDRELTEQEITYLCDIEVPCVLSVNLGDDRLVCEGDQITFDVSDIAGQYQWQDGTTGPTMQVDGPGIYHVTVTDDGCVASDTVSVQFVSPPQVALGADTLLCGTGPFSLSVDQPDAQITWSDGTTGSTLLVSETGYYWASVQVNGCPPAIDSIMVVFVDGQPFEADTSICPEQTIVIGQQFTDADYLWSTGATTPFIEVMEPDTYAVEIAVGPCVLNGSYTVTESIVPQVGLVDDTAHCFIEPLVLVTALSGHAHSWSDGTDNDSITVTESGAYSVEVTVNGCVSADTVLITEGTCDLLFIMPTVFTPNGDGVNELFTPLVSDNVVGMVFKVYNRWGLLLFESDRLDTWWDGRTPSGARASDGTYFWMAEVSDFGGNVHAFHGTVTLLQ